MNFNQSKIKCFRRCQKQYAFLVDYSPEGYELKPKYPSLPLKIGGWLHMLQEAYHYEWAGITTKTWKEVHGELEKNFNLLFDEEKEKYGEDLPDEAYRLFSAYRRHYKYDSERYRVATLHDGKPAVEFVVEAPLARSHMFKGRIDLVVEDQEYGGLWVWDAKWMRKIPSADERMMNPQGLMYPWALKRNGYDIRGFVFNYGRKKPPAIPAVLKKGFLTTKHSLDSDVYTYLREIKRLHGDDWKYYAGTYYAAKIKELRARHNDWFRRERVPVDHTRINAALREFKATARDILRRQTDDIPRTYLYNCKFNCDYHDPCVAEFTGRDITQLLKKNYQIVEERYIGEPDLDD
jgi:PD-(D/E)XK nuclease superfamily